MKVIITSEQRRVLIKILVDFIEKYEGSLFQESMYGKEKIPIHYE